MYTINYLSETANPANKGAFVYPTYAAAVEKSIDLGPGYGVFKLADGAAIADDLLQTDWPVVFNEPDLFQVRALSVMLVDPKQGLPYALFGLMDELGELIDASNKRDELGDVHWCAAVASHFLGWPYAEVIGVAQAPSLNLPVPMLMELLREAMLPAFVPLVQIHYLKDILAHNELPIRVKQLFYVTCNPLIITKLAPTPII